MIFSTTMEYVHTEQDWYANTHRTTFQYLTDFKNVTYKTTATTQTFVVFNPEYFKVLMGVLTWDFSFFPEGSAAEYVRYIVFVPITLAAMYVLAHDFINMLQGFIP